MVHNSIARYKMPSLVPTLHTPPGKNSLMNEVEFLGSNTLHGVGIGMVDYATVLMYHPVFFNCT